MTETSDLARSKMKHEWTTCLETRGKGGFDRKWTGMEMTNKKGVNCLENFSKVTNSMLSMYDADTREHTWLKIRTPEWEMLAKALSEVHCFLKNQKKRDPEECDNKLYAL